MTIATQSQKDRQADVIARTSRDVSDTVIAFDRYVPVVADKPCTCENGHITVDNAAFCGQDAALAELAYLADLPVEIDDEAKLAAVAITVATRPRFMGRKADGTNCGCPFGHRTQKAASSCVGAGQRASAKAARAKITVATAGALAAVTLAAAANKMAGAEAAAAKAEADKATEPAETAQPEAPKAEAPKRTRKLTSGATGNTGRA